MRIIVNKALRHFPLALSLSRQNKSEKFLAKIIEFPSAKKAK